MTKKLLQDLHQAQPAIFILVARTALLISFFTKKIMELLVRIEDTDKERSEEHIAAIMDGLDWDLTQIMNQSNKATGLMFIKKKPSD